MTYTRLTETVQTLYAELLDQLRAADAEAAARGASGTFVSKNIRGRTYWYLQRSEGAVKRQIYLGPESPELLERIENASNERASAAADEQHRRELVRMLSAGGMFRESAAIGTVLRILADSGVFRAGGMLVGTQAFTTIGNLLGVAFEKSSVRTADVDIAHASIPLAITETGDVDLLERLREHDPRFFAVPGIDSREPSTSFKVRGRDLRVDFVTPASGRRRDSSKPVYLRHLRIAAQPLTGLDYLTEVSIDAALITGAGIRANVPDPARFAFHKLWLASVRPASEAPKAKKDLRQAEQILDVLIDDRPDDVVVAWSALQRRRSLLRGVNASIKRLDAESRERLRDVLR